MLSIKAHPASDTRLFSAPQQKDPAANQMQHIQPVSGGETLGLSGERFWSAMARAAGAERSERRLADDTDVLGTALHVCRSLFVGVNLEAASGGGGSVTEHKHTAAI